MKATIILGLLLGLALLALAFEPLVAAGPTLQAAAGRQEPAWMVLSGASLLTVASLVRRYIP
jgi:hypothetical protein